MRGAFPLTRTFAMVTRTVRIATMPIHAIAPSPLARLLLELEARGASGGVDIGGRRMVLTKGSIVEVRTASADASPGGFFVAAGRLSEADLPTPQTQPTAQRTRPQ